MMQRFALFGASLYHDHIFAMLQQHPEDGLGKILALVLGIPMLNISVYGGEFFLDQVPDILSATTHKPQFFALSTSLFLAIHGIMPRRRLPTSSIGCSADRRRRALKDGLPALFSSIQSRAKRPDCMSASTRFISFLVSSVTMRGPVT